MRSIENNRETVIASNTGPSGLIRSNGRLDKHIEKNMPESIIVHPNLINQNTFYSKFGLKTLAFTFTLILTFNFLRGY